MAPARRGAPGAGQGTLGTFAGVFTPSVLTILGIILFLRLGYVVGNAGLGRALLLVALANTISVLTSISLSAIATNLKVRGGGDYYLISRTLGLEFGGAIGAVLFLAQSVSIAFYCLGFGEAVAGFVPQHWSLSPQWVAGVAVALLFVFAWLGADWATRFQYVVMVTLAASLVSFFVGGAEHWNSAVLTANWVAPAGALPFWAVFAIFFPAVTGFTQGVSMSGDLRDPGSSLPRGTFLAVGVSIVVYFAAAILFAGTVPSVDLIADYGAMKRVAHYGFLVDAGVVAATLSSAMASYLGAPRILQAAAKDRIFPWLVPFAAGAGPSDNPRRGVLLSTVIAGATIALGNLNLVARLVSMFFLISYGLLNYATYYEARTGSPSFRPRFRWFHARVSLAGALLCLGCMLALDPAAGVAAVAVLMAIYQYLRRTAGPARWADSRRSYHLSEIRQHLLATMAEPDHPRDWRPQMLAFSRDPARRSRLVRVAAWLGGGSGLTTAVQIVEGRGVSVLRERGQVEEVLRRELGGEEAFPLVVAAPRLELGLSALVQAYGVGPLRANTILLNWFEEEPVAGDAKNVQRYGRNLRATYRLGCNLCILATTEEGWAGLGQIPAEQRRIDLWWTAGDATSRLMLLLSYLMTRSEDWGGCEIRLLAATAGRDHQAVRTELDGMLADARIAATPVVVDVATAAGILEECRGASFVFLPFRLRDNAPCGPWGCDLAELIAGLPTTLLVLAAEDIDLDATPEEGTAGEMAAARDAALDARKKAEAAEAQAAAAAAMVEGKLEELDTAVATGADDETLARVRRERVELQAAATKASRRAAREAAKAEYALQEAAELGVGLPTPGETAAVEDPEDAGDGTS
ncbi:MAG: amino acid permease [Deferrisomatales bacterium]|nr:amino acid permease [Deferrisomatales bacterium]